MLRIGLFWRGLLKVELEILQNYRKIATLAFLRERQKAADMGTGTRPRLIISRHELKILYLWSVGNAADMLSLVFFGFQEVWEHILHSISF